MVWSSGYVIAIVERRRSFWAKVPADKPASITTVANAALNLKTQFICLHSYGTLIFNSARKRQRRRSELMDAETLGHCCRRLSKWQVMRWNNSWKSEIGAVRS